MDKIGTIRSALDLVEEMDLRGITCRKQGRTHGSAYCPHCGEGAKFSNKLNIFRGADGMQRYKCMACGRHGDVIDFVMAVDGLSQKDAIDTLAKKAGWSPVAHPAPRKPANPDQATPVATQPASTKALALCKDHDAATTGSPVRQDERDAATVEAMAEVVDLIRASVSDPSTLGYLVESRKLSKATVRMAVSGGMLAALPAEPAAARERLLSIAGRDRLMAAGILRDGSEWPAAAFMPLIGIPPGRTALQFRRIAPARNPGDPRYVVYGHVRWPYTVHMPGKANQPPSRIAIVEGFIDALSFSECREAGSVDVILGIPGTSSWKPAWIAAIETRIRQDGLVLLALDDNAAGDACSLAIEQFMIQSGSRIASIRLRPTLQDWNRTLKKRKEET